MQTYTQQDLDRIIELYQHGDPKAIRRDPVAESAVSIRGLFCDSAPAVMDLPDRDTFLWRFMDYGCKTKYGSNWKFKPQYQKEGTCAGQTTKLAQDTVASLMAAIYGLEFPGRFSVAGNYAGARVDIDGQPGNWQGASMASMVLWSERYGALLLSDLGLAEDDLDKDEAYAIAWTRTREGVPPNFELLAKNHPIKDGRLVVNAREAGKSIQNGNPVIQGSTLIPNGKRDSRGFSHVARSGGHATLFWAVRYNPFGLFYMNSWSALWGSGPVWPDDMPAGGVWLDEDESNQIIAQQQAYAMLGIDGLKPRLLAT